MAPKSEPDRRKRTWLNGGNKPKQPMNHPWRRAVYPRAAKAGRYTLTDQSTAAQAQGETTENTEHSKP